MREPATAAERQARDARVPRPVSRAGPARVLLTRAADRLEVMIDGCEALGLRPVALPCLAIEWVDAEVDVAPGALAVFTSVYAVRGAARLRPFPWTGVRVLAIGAATAAALAGAGQPVLAPPVEPYTSEALLDWLVSPTGASAVRGDAGAVVVGGQGGRDAIVRGLAASGMETCALEVYRRVRPRPSRASVAAALSPPPAVTCTTSDEGLDNLLAIAGAYAGALLERPLVVNGERGAAHARRRGFGADVLVARPAGDRGQLEALRRWSAGDAIGAPITGPGRP